MRHVVVAATVLLAGCATVPPPRHHVPVKAAVRVSPPVPSPVKPVSVPASSPTVAAPAVPAPQTVAKKKHQFWHWFWEHVIVGRPR